MTYRELFYLYPTETWKRYLEHFRNLINEDRTTKEKLLIVGYLYMSTMVYAVRVLFDRFPETPGLPRVEELLDTQMGSGKNNSTNSPL